MTLRRKGVSALSGVEIAEKFCLFLGKVTEKSTCPSLILSVNNHMTYYSLVIGLAPLSVLVTCLFTCCQAYPTVNLTSAVSGVNPVRRFNTNFVCPRLCQIYGRVKIGKVLEMCQKYLGSGLRQGGARWNFENRLHSNRAPPQ